MNRRIIAVSNTNVIHPQLVLAYSIYRYIATLTQWIMTASLLPFCRKSSKQKHQHKQEEQSKLQASSSSSSSSSSVVPSNQPYSTKTSKSPSSTISNNNITTKITMQDLKEFTSSIPLRLSPSERALLTVLESTLTVSEYTDTVDVASTRYGGVRGGGPKIRRILDGVLEACHVATGLGVAGMLDHPSVVLRGITSNGCGSGGRSSGRRREAEEGGGCSSVGRTNGTNSNNDNDNNSNIIKTKSTTTDGTVATHMSRKRAKQAEKARKKEEKRLLKMKGKKKKNNKASSVALEGDDETTTTTNDDTKTGASASATAARAEDATLSAVSAVEGITIDSSEEPTSTTTATTTTSDMTTDDAHDNATNNNSNDSSSSSNNNENKAPTSINNNNNKTLKSKTPKQNKNNNTYHPHVPHYTNLTSIALLPPSQNELFFQNIFEIGRRNKVLNPSKMRDTYGKLMHLLQDAQSPSIAKSLGFSLYKDMVMVRPFLEARGLDGILDDERLVTATMFISTRDRKTGEVVDRGIVEEGVRRKKDCIDELLGEYADNRGGGGSTTTTAMEEDTTINITTRPSPESLSSSSSNDDDGNNIVARQDLQRCIDSIADAIAVVECNVSPVRRMLHLLEENFSPHSPNKNKGQSLELRGSGGTCFSSNSSSNSNHNGNRYGYGFGAFGSSFGGSNSHSKDSSGPTLNHSHSTQYTFVWQSLRLWEEVQMRMHKLWVCADDDLLSTTTSYQLLNTGQGLNRVQSCPRVGKVMRSLLSKTQKAANAPWVGLSVIHLGDRDVPNALVFIDKYTQIPRFLKPVVDFCDGIPDMCTDRRIASYVDTQFGSEKDLEMAVLADYFKHGFDGSGDDGGSCIDGRLTSSWNWTSRVVKKNYYHFFMLSGFQGFDGDFK